MAKSSKTSRGLSRLHTVYTYSLLYNAAYLVRLDAKENVRHPDDQDPRLEFFEKYSFSYSIATVVLCAFTLESYLNHLIRFRFPEHTWKALEWLSPQEKLNLLATELKLKLDLSGRPFQTFGEIFGARTALAHGRTHEAEDKGHLDKNGRKVYELPKWMMNCTPERADIYVKDTTAMIEALHKASGIEISALGTSGESTGQPSNRERMIWRKPE